MQSGEWPVSDVQEIVTTVLVNGVSRPHESWSADREISGDLPVQVVSASGLRQATGSITWAFKADVLADPVSPWNAFGEWLPKRGDRVEIWAGNSTVSYCQFTGVIDKTTGSIGDGFQSTIIDDYDKGSAKVRHEPLMAVMPPSTPGLSFLGTGLTHTYYVDLAMRAAGFYTTPKAQSAAVHVPCQGGMWPHIGTITTANVPSGGSYPTNNYGPWGFACADFTQLITPNSPKTMSDPVQLTAIISPAHNGLFSMRAIYGASYIELQVNSDWVVAARLDGVSLASFTMPGKGGATPQVVQMVVKDGRFTLKASSGQSSSSLTPFSGSTAMATVRLSGDANVRVSGIEVSHPSVAGEFHALNFKPTATINVSNTSMMGIQRAAPAINDRTANDILDEISKATLSACWIDETGIMRWYPSIVLRGRNPSQVVTTLNDVLDLSWEDGLLQSASRVTIKYKSLVIRISVGQNVRMHIGSGGSLESGESSTDVIEAPSDEAWYGIDETPTILRTGNWAPYNLPRGSYLGGFFTASGSTTSEAGLSYTASMAKRAHNVYVITQSVGTLPADVVFNLSTSPTDATLWETRRDKPLFEIGGHAVAKWTDLTFTPSQVGGVGPELEHDGGIWIPDSAPQIYFDYIAGQTATPQPVISGLEVVFDPRRQVGDLITIESNKYMRVSLTALIVGVSNNADNGDITQSLTVRVVGVAKNGTTYADLNAELPAGLTYAAFNALSPTPQTYSAFNNS